jgi:hypothetical protein
LAADPVSASLGAGALLLSLDAATHDVRIEHVDDNDDGSEVVRVRSGAWERVFVR